MRGCQNKMTIDEIKSIYSLAKVSFRLRKSKDFMNSYSERIFLFSNKKILTYI